MRIAIDARMIMPGDMHGIARYVFELLQCLREIKNDHKFFIITNSGNPLNKHSWPEHMEIVKAEGSWMSFRQQIELPKLLRKLKADIYHATSFMAPIFCPCNLVMTIHDLNHLVLPQFYTPFHQMYYRTFVKSCIKRSKYILTVSNFSKDEIVRTLGVPSEKVHVTYNGVSKRYKPIVDKEKLQYIRDIYELPEKFIFCLSPNKPHKNVHQLVKAFCFSNINIPLVLTSAVDQSIIRIAENYGKKHLIYFSKFINEEHLPYVYSMTHLFVYPSTYEGFGLPPLEALACGAPVVVARSSSLPEVVGNSAIFTNPFDYHDIARALELGSEDEKLRQKLREMSPQHAAKFTWNEMASQTLDLYERCEWDKTAQTAEATLT